MVKANSPKKTTDQVLGVLSVDEVKIFLMECANLPDPIGYPANRPRFDRWLRKWQRFFTFQSESEDGKWRTMEIPKEQLELFVPKVQIALWRIWVEQDARQRDWYFYRLRDEYHRMVVRAENPYLLNITDRDAVNHLLQLIRTSRDRGDNPPQRARFFETAMGTDLFGDVPRICPFEAALYWLQINQRLMLRCGGSDCAAPYFFRTEKGQKFCSPECADPARREAKLRWWNQSPNSPKNQPRTKLGKESQRAAIPRDPRRG
jgi:hypothetical protein